MLRPRRVIFEATDAELIYRAARVGARALGKDEQGRIDLALRRLKALAENMKRRDSSIIELATEEYVRSESLQQLRQRERS